MKKIDMIKITALPITTRLRLVRSAKNEALCCTEPSVAGLFIMGIGWEGWMTLLSAGVSNR
jgi:hypothetical protein